MRYKPYVSVGQRTWEDWLKANVFPPAQVLAASRAEGKKERKPPPMSSWDQHERMRRHVLEPCPGDGRVIGCHHRSIKPVFLVKPRDVLESGVLPSAFDEESAFTTDLCDGCALLWYAGGLGYQCKTRWVKESARLERMAVGAVRARFSQDFERLREAIGSQVHLAHDTLMGYQQRVVSIEVRIGEPLPTFPEGKVLSHVDFRDAPVFVLYLWDVQSD